MTQMPDELTDQERTHLELLREHTLGILGAYERRLGVILTTADMRLWIEKRGPSVESIVKQVAFLRRCAEEDAT